MPDRYGFSEGDKICLRVSRCLLLVCLLLFSLLLYLALGLRAPRFFSPLLTKRGIFCMCVYI